MRETAQSIDKHGYGTLRRYVDIQGLAEEGREKEREREKGREREGGEESEQERREVKLT